MNTYQSIIPVSIFVRVSSKNQDYERQIRDLTAYASKQGYQVEAIIEEVVSASKTSTEHRKAVATLLDLARSGTISKVLVSEISRLGRKTSEVLKIIEDLSAAKVSVYALNYNLETLTLEGRRNPIASLLFTLLAEFARMETETMAERILSGQAEARRKGKHLGRPAGTIKKPDEILTNYPGIVKDLKEGLSIRKTAAFRKVSINTVQTVKKAMQNI
jgi:DNA invertase Pin-like site-specific DNA recombinase